MSHYVPAPTGKPVRIGDAERDEAVTALSEHFVAGRLTQDEFEERSNQATRARYADDLTPLFDDLPDPMAAQLTPPWSPALRHRSPPFRPGSPRFRSGPPPFFRIVPVLIIGLVITAIVLSAPWILWVLFWVALFGGFRHRRHHHHHTYRR